MKQMLSVLSFFAMLTLAHAEMFHLVDAAGKQYGPFEFRQGEKLSVAGQEYTISKVLTDDQQILATMKRIILPEVEFREAKLLDVVRFLQYATKAYDAEPHDLLGFAFKPDPPNAQPGQTPEGSSASAFEAKTEAAPLITISARLISVKSLMDIVCKITNLKWSVENSVIMLEPMEKDQGITTTAD